MSALEKSLGNFKETADIKVKDIDAQSLKLDKLDTSYQNSFIKTKTDATEKQVITRNNNQSTGSLTLPETNSLDDVSGNKESYSPNSQGLSNTGGGAEAALGTQYTWNKQSSDKAQSQYLADLLAQKQTMLNNRQTIANNAVNYQAQSDMLKYQNNQNAEKVGWTGGYVLDQNRQMDYLKQSIQAQMYGAIELQKYGYDSSLAAARLSYDLNQQEYARQYYQDAVSAALSEAQLTGTYFSAETKDMMSQYAVAEQKLNDPTIPQEERDQAKRIKDTIISWFGENQISPEGVKTLEAWEREQAQELAWSQEYWMRYNAALESAKSDLDKDASTFLFLDENGREIWDGINVRTGNWEALTNKDLLTYIFSGSNGSINGSAVQQYYSYLDSTLVGQTEAAFNKWCVAHGYIATDENGNTQIKTGTSSMPNLFLTFLKSSGTLKQLQDKYKDLEKEENFNKFGEIMRNWDFNFELPDGTTISKTYDELQNETWEEPKASEEPGAPIEQPNDPGNPDSGTTQVTDYAGNVLKNYTFTTPEKSQYGDYKSTLSQGTQVCLTTAYWDVDHRQDIAGNLNETDIAVIFGDQQDTDQTKGFNVEIAADEPKLGGTANEINSMIYAAQGRPPVMGQIITLGGVAYVYVLSNKDIDKCIENGVNWNTTNNMNGRKVTSNVQSGWYPIKGQCNGSTTENYLLKALDDSKMVVGKTES